MSRRLSHRIVCSILLLPRHYTWHVLHPKWQKKRLEILSRDGFKCLACGCTETTLHVHHLSYAKGREPWEYDEDNFQTLCQYCHRITGDTKEPLVTVLIYDIGEDYLVYYALTYVKYVDSYTAYTYFISETLFEFKSAIGGRNLSRLFMEMERHRIETNY